MKKVLSIAGSDCSGGAGIQADLKTMSAYNVYGMSVITALTAQNTTGVYGISNVTPDFIEKQIDCVFEDIFPNAVKIGMVSNCEIIKTIACSLKKYQAENIVVDPVMVATSGGKLMSPDSVDALVNELLPIADIITPNIPEAEVLAHTKIITKRDMEEAARIIIKSFGGSVLIKGGHAVSHADDMLMTPDGTVTWLESERIDTENTHGTGCTLSSAIASGLALGMTIPESVKVAKEFVYNAIAYGLNLGNGNGPLNHCFEHMR